MGPNRLLPVQRATTVRGLIKNRGLFNRVMVKIFTMVKGENDIVRDWVKYHGKIFGYDNLFVIDNMSRDGTFEILNEFRGKIHIFRIKANHTDTGDIGKVHQRLNCCRRSSDG